MFSVTTDDKVVKISIAGTLHCCFHRNYYLGFHTSIEYDKCYSVTITLRGANMVLYYDTREKWLAMIEILGELALNNL